MLSHRDLDIGVCGDAQEALPDRDRLLGRIEANLEDLLRSLEVTDEPLELTLLLFALTSRGTQLARPLDGLVHESRVGLSNSYHVLSSLKPTTRVVFIAAMRRLHGRLYAFGIV
jgi:hypothetical protein